MLLIVNKMRTKFWGLSTVVSAMLLMVLSTWTVAGIENLTETFAPFSPEQYVRPYGPGAPWNIPVIDLPRHPQSSHWVDILWRLSTADRPGNFNLGGFENYSYPIYLADAATGMIPVVSRHPDWGNIHGQTIPWNPEWKQSPGSDGQVIVLDPATGREWNLWQVRFEGNRLRVGNGNLVSADYRTKEDGFPSSRGCGIQYLAMLTRPEEIMQGQILHALSMPAKNPNSKCFVSPATKTDGDRFGIPDGVPEGMRFALDVSDQDIEVWLEQLPVELGPATRYSARVIARALRDYGWIITDNSGGAFFQFESNLTAEQKWNVLGLTKREIKGKQYPRDLLDGLLTPERIYAIVPSEQYPPRVPEDYDLVYQTSFEGVAKADEHRLKWDLPHWCEFAARHREDGGKGSGEGGGRMWVESNIVRSGNNSIGLELFDIEKSRRAELAIFPEDMLGQEYYVSYWIYLPENWGLHDPTIEWDWYEIGNPVSIIGFPYIAIYITNPDAENKAFDVGLGGRGVDGKKLHGVSKRMPLPRARWFNIMYHVNRHPTVGSTRLWFDGQVIGELTNIATSRQGNVKHQISVAKIYHERGDRTPKQIWIDDLKLYTRKITPQSMLR